MQAQALRNVGVRGRAWHGHWYRVPRASGSVSLASGAALGANLADGVVNDALQFAWVGLGIARFDVLNGPMKYAPADSFFDELGEVALLHTLGAQKGAQGEVGFLGHLDVPADGFFHEAPTYVDKHLYTYRRPQWLGSQTRLATTVSDLRPLAVQMQIGYYLPTNPGRATQQRTTRPRRLRKFKKSFSRTTAR